MRGAPHFLRLEPRRANLTQEEVARRPQSFVSKMRMKRTSDSELGRVPHFWLASSADAGSGKKAASSGCEMLPALGFDCFGLASRASCFDGDLHSTFHRIFEGHLDSEQAVLVGRFGFVRFHRPT